MVIFLITVVELSTLNNNEIFVLSFYFMKNNENVMKVNIQNNITEFKK